MGTFILKNAYVSLGTTAKSNDLSQYVRAVAVTHEAETQDDTYMGSDSRHHIGALKNWAVEVEFTADYATTSLEKTLSTKLGQGPTSSGAGFWVEIRPEATIATSANPEYEGRAMLVSYGPVSGAIGDMATHSASFVGVGDLDRIDEFIIAVPIGQLVLAGQAPAII